MLEKRKRINSRGFNFKLFSLMRLNPSAFLAFFIGFGAGVLLNEGWIASSTEKAHIRACFSPEGQCTTQIVLAIDKTTSSIFVSAYSFTCSHIADALARAFERGVDVRILIHEPQLYDRRSQLSFLSQKGIPVFIDPAVGLAHNKIMILDNRYVLTGSFNFTKNANFRNAENVLLIDDPSLAHIYKQKWEERAAFGREVTVPTQDQEADRSTQ